MPTAIVLENISFVSNNEREKFKLLQESLDQENYDRAVFQLVVRGNITCKTKVMIETLSDGGPGFGDAFGYEGAYKCKIENATVSIFQRNSTTSDKKASGVEDPVPLSFSAANHSSRELACDCLQIGKAA